MEERIYLSEDLDTGRAVFVPDVLIHPKLGNLPGTADLADTTTMEISGPIDLDDLFEEIHEPYVTIIDRAGRSVVAIIEVLSPSNKVANSSGRASFFLATRREIFASNSHWIEIDLLRAGELSPGSRAALPQHEYAVKSRRKTTT